MVDNSNMKMAILLIPRNDTFLVPGKRNDLARHGAKLIDTRRPQRIFSLVHHCE